MKWLRKLCLCVAPMLGVGGVLLVVWSYAIEEKRSERAQAHRDHMRVLRKGELQNATYEGARSDREEIEKSFDAVNAYEMNRRDTVQVAGGGYVLAGLSGGVVGLILGRRLRRSVPAESTEPASSGRSTAT